MKLLDTYVRVESPEINEQRFRRLATILQERLIPICRNFSETVGISGESEFVYYLEQGSIINRNNIVSALLATYVTLGGYHDFRESVIQLYEDVRSASSAIVNEFKNVVGSKESDIRYKRTESRDVKRLYRLVQNVDLLSSGHRFLPETRPRQAAQIVTDLAGLLRSNPNEPELRGVLDIIPQTDHIPPIPRDPDEVLALDRRRRLSSHQKAALTSTRPWFEPDADELQHELPLARHYVLPPPSYVRRRTKPLRYDRTIKL
jgi:hypothetical protein